MSCFISENQAHVWIIIFSELFIAWIVLKKTNMYLLFVLFLNFEMAGVVEIYPQRT